MEERGMGCGMGCGNERSAEDVNRSVEQSVQDNARLVEAALLYKVLAKSAVAFDGDLATTKTQDVAIHTLKVFGEVTMGELGRKMSIPKEQASRVVASLEERGIVARRHSDENKRRVYVSLTEEGERFIRRRSLVYSEKMEQRLAPLSPHEREELLLCSTKASELIKKALSDAEDCRTFYSQP